MTLQELIVKVGADISEYVENLDQAISKAKSTEASFASIGATLSAGLTAPLTAVGGAALKAASDIAGAMREIRIGTGETGTGLKDLGDTFKAVFADVDESASEVAKVITDLHRRLGLTGQPLEALSKQVLDLAEITHSDLGQTIEATTRLFGEWQVATNNQAETLDFFFRVSQNSGIAVTKLEGELTEFGPTLKNLGFSLQDAALLLAQFDKSGVDAAGIMPGLRKEFANLAKSGIDGAAAFKQIVAGIQDGSITLKEALDIFGAKGGGTIFRQIKEGKFDFDNLKKAVDSSSDSISKVADETETLGKAMSKAWHEVELALQPIGDVLKTALRTGFEDAKPLLNAIHDLGESFKSLDSDTQKTIIAIGALAAAAGPAALAVAGITTALASPALAAAAPIIGEIVAGLVAIKATGADQAIIELVKAFRDDFPGLVDLVSPIRDALVDTKKALLDIVPVLGNVQISGKAMVDALLPGFAAIRDAAQLWKQAMDSLSGRRTDFEAAAKADIGNLYAGGPPTGSLSGGGGKGPAPSLQALLNATRGGGPLTGGGTIDLSGIGKGAEAAILSVDQLIKKQAELEQSVRKAEQVVADLTAREQAGQPVAFALAEAHSQLSKALKDVADKSTDVATIMRAALADQTQSEGRVNALAVAYRSLKEAYDRTGEGAGALAKVHEELDSALKKVGKSLGDLGPALANPYAAFSEATQKILKEQDDLEAKAEEAAARFEEIRQGFLRGDVSNLQLKRAFDELKQAIDAAGLSAADLSTKVHMVGDGIPIITGGVEKLTQFGGETDSVIKDINKGLQDMDVGVSKVGIDIPVLRGGIDAVKSSTDSAAQSATNLTAAFGSTIEPVSSLEQHLRDVGLLIVDATAQAASFAQELLTASQTAAQGFATFEANSMASHARGPSLGNFELYDPQHPERGGYTIDWQYRSGTGYPLAVMTYHEPFTPEKLSPNVPPGVSRQFTHGIPTNQYYDQLAAAAKAAGPATQNIDSIIAGYGGSSIPGDLLKLLLSGGLTGDQLATALLALASAAKGAAANLDGLSSAAKQQTSAVAGISDIAQKIKDLEAVGVSFEDAVRQLGGRIEGEGDQIQAVFDGVSNAAESAMLPLAALGNAAAGVVGSLGGMPIALNDFSDSLNNVNQQIEPTVQLLGALGGGLAEVTAHVEEESKIREQYLADIRRVVDQINADNARDLQARGHVALSQAPLFLPSAPTLPSVTLPQGAISPAGGTVIINNPTFLNRSMVDYLTSELHGLGIGL